MRLAPSVVLFVGAMVMVALLLVERDRPDWQPAAPVILMRAAILVAMGITIGVVLILTER